MKKGSCQRSCETNNEEKGGLNQISVTERECDSNINKIIIKPVESATCRAKYELKTTRAHNGHRAFVSSVDKG